MNLPNYSLITSAKNEEAYISHTIKSVLAQNYLPKEWIIVNDGSTDTTLQIIKDYANVHPWIKVIDLQNFKPELKTTGGRVAHMLNIAIKQLTVNSEIITKLDADLSFDPNFFEQLLSEFAKEPSLGIASGTLVYQGKVESVDYTSDMTRGAVMMIRNEVVEKTGGFFESKGSGEDRLFAVAARSWGYKTRSFPVFFNHLRPEGLRHGSLFESYVAGFYKGSIPYRFDYFILTLAKYALRKPIIIGVFIELYGYLKSRLMQRYRPFPHYVATQLKKEQKALILKALKFR